MCNHSTIYLAGFDSRRQASHLVTTQILFPKDDKSCVQGPEKLLLRVKN